MDVDGKLKLAYRRRIVDIGQRLYPKLQKKKKKRKEKKRICLAPVLQKQLMTLLQDAFVAGFCERHR
jgi:hypothetical protein